MIPENIIDRYNIYAKMADDYFENNEIKLSVMAAGIADTYFILLTMIPSYHKDGRPMLDVYKNIYNPHHSLNEIIASYNWPTMEKHK